MNLSGVSYLPSMLTCNPGISSSALAVFRRMTPLVSRTSVPSLTVTSIRPIPSVWTHTVLLSTRAVTTPLMRSSAAAEVAHDHTMAAVSSEPSAMRNRMRLERISHLLLDDRGVDTPRHPSVSVRQKQHHRVASGTREEWSDNEHGWRPVTACGESATLASPSIDYSALRYALRYM